MQYSEKTTAEAYPARSAWLGLVAVYGGFVSFGFVFHFLPPMLPVVIADLGIGRGAAGLLMSLFALPGILLSLPGGWLVDRYGERAVGGGGLLVMGLGTVALGLAPGFALILAARVVSGCGAMLAIVALQRLVVRLFAGRGLGLPLGVSGSAIPLGIVVVLNTSGPLAEAAGWRTVTLRVGLAVVALGLLFLAVVWLVTRGRDLGRDRAATDPALPVRGRAFAPIWIGGLVWFAANAAMTVFVTFAPDHYLDLGLGASSRGFLTSIPMWTSAALGVLTGWLTDRHGGRALFMAAGMGLMALALAAVPGSVVPHALIGFALGMALAVVVTPTLALPGALLPESHVGRGYGILATCANTGVFVLPPLAGSARDTSGGYGWPFALATAVAAAGMLAAVGLARGRYMPGWSWRRLAPALVALVVLIGGSGCGRQDRYTVTTPERAGIVTLVGGSVSRMGRLPFGGVWTSDAWSAAAYVQSGPDGAVVLRAGDRITPLDYPGDALVTGLLCEPDGVLRTVDEEGAHRTWEAGRWQDAPGLPEPAAWLIADAAGRPLVQLAYSGHLVRFRGGAWEPVVEDTWGIVGRAWAAPGAGTWAVTGSGAVLEIGDEAVVCRDTLSFARGGPETLTGDADGRLFCGNYSGEFWLYEDGTWSPHGEVYGRAFPVYYWIDGVLHGFESHFVHRWAEGIWEKVAERTDDRISVDRFLALDDGGVLVSGGSGETWVLRGTQMETLGVGLARVEGVAEVEGGLLVYLRGGGLIHSSDPASGPWTVVGIIPDGPAYARDLSLVRDDRGRAVLYGQRELWEWDGNGLQRRDDLASGSYGMFPQADGSVLLPRRDGVVSLQAGDLTLHPAPGLNPYEVRGLWRDGSLIGVASSDRVTRYPADGEPRTEWLTVGWRPDRLVDLGDGEALVMGPSNCWLVGPGGSWDLTPVDGGERGVRHRVTAGLRRGDGTLLAWSSSASAPLLFDGDRWWEVDPAKSDPLLILRSYAPYRLLPLDDGSVLAVDDDALLRFDLTGLEP